MTFCPTPTLTVDFEPHDVSLGGEHYRVTADYYPGDFDISWVLEIESFVWVTAEGKVLDNRPAPHGPVAVEDLEREKALDRAFEAEYRRLVRTGELAPKYMERVPEWILEEENLS